VHATLSRVALDADPSEVARAAAFFGRTLGASDDEIVAATEAAVRALASPVIKSAAAALELRREAPLAVMLDDGALVEGIADLAFTEENGGQHGWVVADFKTDVEIAGRLDEYRTQIALYVRAIQRATGLNARGVILRV
jgi:ATP-dependent exoDNAse (exonuclease V) beta subunit